MTHSIRAGELRNYITLQAKIFTRDDTGGEVPEWQDRGVNIPAAVEPFRGRELMSAKAEESETTIRFRIRYRSDVISAWRILWEGQPYEIIDVIDILGAHVEIHLNARTQVNP